MSLQPFTSPTHALMTGAVHTWIIIGMRVSYPDFLAEAETTTDGHTPFLTITAPSGKRFRVIVCEIDP